MVSQDSELEDYADLRLRAVSSLTGRTNTHDFRESTVKALRVLHDLASSPDTAVDALALLHELQVHQVELDLQGENLRSSLTELEAELDQRTARYEFAPAAILAVDSATGIIELNRAAAELFGREHHAMVGRTLDGFLVPSSGRVLQAMLARTARGSHHETDTLRLALADGVERSVRTAVSADPVTGCFLVALMDLGEQARHER